VLLNDQVGIVSGVGLGLGRSIALRLAREGADVVLAARNEEVMRGVAAEVESVGRRALCVPTDITSREHCVRLADAASAEFGRIDVLVNNAFTSRPVVTFVDSHVSAWRSHMETNFWGSLTMTQAVVPHMREQGGGGIVMVSTALRHVREGSQGYGAYLGSKGALRAACRVLARELGPSGIRVNTVAPGNISGPNLERHLAERAEVLGVDIETLRSQLAAEYPLGYIPSPDDVAGAVLFFASDLGRAVTGQFMLANGGQFIE
jgi:NAD(P)-dependent dehydrogenase (short-subunit alcohol dehydrogenase family)